MKIVIVAGARPNFMKVAPLIEAVRAFNRRSSAEAPIEYKLVHTGQHYDARMSQVFFDEMGIPAPDVNLEVGSGSHAVQTAKILTAFEPVCLQLRPDWVVVVGDVNSTMACTLVASKLGIKVAHVEAGLRSFDRTMPEEINRLVTDAIADLLLTPSPDADENLRREGVPVTKIKLVGNVMIDALVANLPKARRSNILDRLQIQRRGFAYVTLHRPSNVDVPETLALLAEQLERLAKDLPVIFPMHPRTRKTLAESHLSLEGKPGVSILDPLGYHDSLALTDAARLVLTDSGGLQEESTYLRTPCLTLRANTERPITVTVGSNRLTTPHRLANDVSWVLSQKEAPGRIPDLWDGQAAGRILHALLEVSSRRNSAVEDIVHGYPTASNPLMEPRLV
ncbi:MAG: UDP-N-acetylglucosamine 2-epimerase (non-hydrolyzing) [Verrucomicrobiota bacterium]